MMGDALPLGVVNTPPPPAVIVTAAPAAVVNTPPPPAVMVTAAPAAVVNTPPPPAVIGTAAAATELFVEGYTATTDDATRPPAVVTLGFMFVVFFVTNYNYEDNCVCVNETMCYVLCTHFGNVLIGNALCARSAAIGGPGRGCQRVCPP
jgi:hypothetical protein